MTEKIAIFYRRWIWEEGKIGEQLGYVVKDKTTKYAHCTDDKLQEVYKVYNLKDKNVGVVYLTKPCQYYPEGEWHSVPFAGDIGHSGHSSLYDAAQDVLEVYLEITNEA